MTAAVSEEPSRGRPSAWPALAAFVVAFLLVQGATLALLIVAAALRAGGDLQRIAQEVQSFALSAPGVAAAALVSATVLAAVAVAAARLDRSSAADALRLRPSRATTGGVAAAVVGMVGLSVASGTALELLGLRGGQGPMEQIARALATAGPSRLPLYVAAIAVAPAIAEETFFRGLLQTRLVARWGRWPGTTLSAIAFGLIHLDPVQGSVAFLAGLFLGWLAERFESIRPSIAAHATNNALFVALAPWALAGASRRMEYVLATAGCLALLASIAFLSRDFAQAKSRAAVDAPEH
jgi:membrane protease YdiL (CAAX protease family)